MLLKLQQLRKYIYYQSKIRTEWFNGKQTYKLYLFTKEHIQSFLILEFKIDKLSIFIYTLDREVNIDEQGSLLYKS